MDRGPPHPSLGLQDKYDIAKNKRNSTKLILKYFVLQKLVVEDYIHPHNFIDRVVVGFLSLKAYLYMFSLCMYFSIHTTTFTHTNIHDY